MEAACLVLVIREKMGIGLWLALSCIQVVPHLYNIQFEVKM